MGGDVMGNTHSNAFIDLSDDLSGDIGIRAQAQKIKANMESTAKPFINDLNIFFSLLSPFDKLRGTLSLPRAP